MPKSAPNWQPMGDGVLIERLEPIEQARESKIVITDMATADAKMLIRKGKVLAVGLGKWHPGEWWFVKPKFTAGVERGNIDLLGQWEWIDGYREEPDVKPGMTVLFNARWNDFGSRDYQNQLPTDADPTIHLVQEADIAGILA